MGYVQADLKMNFDFEYDIDYSTFNIPIPTPPPLPPPLNLSSDTDTSSNLNIQEMTEVFDDVNNNNNNEESELSDNMLFEELMDAEITMTSENNNNVIDVDVNVIPEVVQEAINFNFDIVKSWMLDVESRPATPVQKEEESPINSLPTEILVHIFKYLNPSDLKIVALVCRRFLDACMYKKLSKRFMLHFVDSFHKQFSVQISQFVDTYRVIPSICVSTGNFDVASTDFWLDYGLNIEELYFRNGILRKKEFEDIIRWTANLKVLKIEANSIFRTWDIKGTYSERIHVFENCYHISLSKNNFLNRKVFDYFMAKAPNLRELDLSFCMQKLSAADRNAMLDHLIFFLKGYGDTIKLINLRQTLIDDFFLDKLSQVQCLKLKSFAITFNGSTTNKKYGIIPLLKAQNQLEDLDLQESPAVEENLAVEIGKNLKYLKRINLRKCSHVTDYCLRELSKLEHLESIDITNCELVTSEGISDALLHGTPKKSLKELFFGLLSNITENVFARIGTKLSQQLTVLDLGGSSNLADDACQTIFYHFPYIQYLNVDSCCKITDYGLTGKCEKQVYFSIKNLRGLKILRMQNLYKPTDFSLIDSFQFNELRELYMARTHFTKAGIQAMVENCPSIELLDLGDIDDIDDEVIEIVTKNLPRLQILKLNGNQKLTSYVFDHIADNCKELKYLYMRNCPNVDAKNINNQLYYMRSLRKVYLD